MTEMGKIQKPRKVDEEGRLFQEKWTYDYLFAKSDNNNKPMCLICQKTIAVNKKTNVQRHYLARHSALYNDFVGKSRFELIETLKMNSGLLNSISPHETMPSTNLLVSTKGRKKRNRDPGFQDQWTYDYLFINLNNKPLCLICHKTVAMKKKLNMQRHYMSKHAAQYDEVKGKERLNKIDVLLKKFGKKRDSDLPLDDLICSNSKRSSGKCSKTMYTDYLFAVHGGKLICLICCKIMHSNKKMKIKVHYAAHHAIQYDNLQGQAREQLLESLKSSLDVRKTLIHRNFSDYNNILQVNFIINDLIKRYNNSTDSDLINECLAVAGSVLCPEKKDLFMNLTNPLQNMEEGESDSLTSKPLIKELFNVSAEIASENEDDICELPQMLVDNYEVTIEVQNNKITDNNNAMYKRTNYLPWDDYFMSIAFLSAMRSKDPCTQVGACIVNEDNKVVAIGYNGMPKGCNDDVLPWAKHSADRFDTKYMYVCHAEMNAVLNKNSGDVAHCKIYVALFPCNECAKVIIQSRIKEVIYHSDKHKDKPETIASKILFDMAGVMYRQVLSQSNVLIDFYHMDKDTGTSVLEENNEDLKPEALINPNERRLDYLSWEEYFMAMAFLSAQRSKDPSTQVGACIVNKNNRIVGIGYNGMPIGCSDDLLPWNRTAENKLDTKYLYVCHAEMNAIMNKNCPDIFDCKLYVVLFPCNECTKLIIQSGIAEVVYFYDKYKETPETKAAKRMLDLAGIKYRSYEGKRHKLNLNFDS